MMGGRPVLPTVRTRPPVPPSRTPTYTVPILNRLFSTLCSCCCATTSSPHDPHLRFTCPDGFTLLVTTIADGFVYLLGPILICLATSIAGGLTYAFVTVMLPMLSPGDSPTSGPNLASPTALCHCALVAFFLINVVHNYVLCVMTRNAGPHYDAVVRELADATGFRYPETEEEVAECKRDYQEKLLERGRRRRAAVRQRVRDAADLERGLGQGQQQSSATAGAASATNGAASASASAVAAAAANGSPAATAADKTSSSSGGASSSSSGGSSNGAAVGPLAAAPAARQPAPPNGATAATTATGPGPAPATPTTSTSTSRPAATPGWMLLNPLEWGFCLHSDQPKPPRSHYDHVTGLLVLNMDHYCPWMFNTVGYFNYRYFTNFLLYVFLGMAYGFAISFKPFMNMNGPAYREQIKLCKSRGFKETVHLLDMVPTPDERTALTFAFMLCLSVGLAVLCLLGFHCYLLLTAQTTIEFHGNFAKKRMAKRRGTRWTNPYSLGWKRNWQQVYGSKHPLLAVLPSSREPEFLPVPIAGDLGRRHPKSKESVLPLPSSSQPTRGAAPITPTPTSSSGMNGSEKTRRRGVVLPV